MFLNDACRDSAGVCSGGVARAQVMSPLVKCHSTVGGGEGRKNCHSTTFTPRSGMCKDIDTFSKSCWSSVDKTKTFKFSTKIHKDAEAAIQSEVFQSESVAFGTSPSKILVATMCFGFGATAKAAGTYGGGYMQPPRPIHATAKSDNQGGSFAPS
jgi:hypothetical protein